VAEALEELGASPVQQHAKTIKSAKSAASDTGDINDGGDTGDAGDTGGSGRNGGWSTVRQEEQAVGRCDIDERVNLTAQEFFLEYWLPGECWIPSAVIYY
jgi:hypothetical protein